MQLPEIAQMEALHLFLNHSGIFQLESFSQCVDSIRVQKKGPRELWCICQKAPALESALLLQGTEEPAVPELTFLPYPVLQNRLHKISFL